MTQHVDEVGFLGERSRLAEGPSARLAATAFAPELDGAPWLWHDLSTADLAHTRELVTAGVIDRATGARLLRALLEVHGLDHRDVTLDPAVGDLYNNRDKLLRERFGSDIGRLHTGRARREATTLAWHLRVRAMLVEALQAVAELCGVLVEVAAAHRSTLVPDFTYLQHAHPTTLGHYLLGFAYPVARSIERFEAVLALINRSPAGAGSVNGSRFPIDRVRLAQSLEFDGVVTHTRDAMWAPDLAMTAMAEVVTAMTTVDRVAEELQLWATEEFGFITLADRHCRTSVIMPQKKNPYAPAMIRGHARALLGDYVAVAATNMTPSGQPDNRVTSYERVPIGLHRLTDSSALLAEVLAETQFHTERMAQQAASGFAYATDVCDYLVVETGVDNRSAHRVVGLAVRQALERGDATIGADDLARAAVEMDVDLPELSSDGVDLQRDLAHLIDVRTGVGAAGALDPMIDELSTLAATTATTYRTHRINDFEDRFLAETRRFAEDLG